MSLLFCDSFDHYAIGDITKKWTSQSGSPAALASGRFGNGLSLGSSQSGLASATKTLASSAATLGLGCAVLFATIPTGSGHDRVVAFYDSGSEQVTVHLNSSGKLYVARGATVLGTGATVLSINVFYYIEVKATIDNTVGAVTVKINGTTEITITGADTQQTANASANQIIIGGDQFSTGGGTFKTYDDLVIWDTSGTANNDFMGDIRVQALLPSGAGTTTAWTPSSGANYTDVDESAPNDDTDYVSSSTPGQIDTYAMGNLTSVAGTIKAVQSLLYARKDDAGVRTIAPVFHISATDYVQANLPDLTTSYQYLPQILEVSPATAVAWTLAEINAMEFGAKEVA